MNDNIISLGEARKMCMKMMEETERRLREEMVEMVEVDPEITKLIYDNINKLYL